MTVTAPELAMHGFLVTEWTAEPSNTAPHEHDDLRWFLPSDLASVALAHPESLPDLLNGLKLAADRA